MSQATVKLTVMGDRPVRVAITEPHKGQVGEMIFAPGEETILMLIQGQQATVHEVKVRAQG